ncbi:unnamed protein product [Mytilus coruscus]|uniref:Uncharacterized protein n=1 Tax=Mytilus coruscus TaxID=42192 RepID=A0A6J8BW77_MYTCO|nr:unnamed protein product [Mytilus coruscus]
MAASGGAKDWLNIQTLFTGALQTDLNLGETWLRQMGNAAKTYGLSLQYCMALPRHALQSLTIPQVTQVRVSEDYLLDPLQWKIGISSIFAYALNVRPYKDTFWTTKNESVNPRYKGKTEPSPALQSVVSTLSTGPVGPGDKINMVNKTVLMRSGKIVYILGEQSKWVPVSPQRITKIEVLPDTLHLHINGTSSETITMNFIVDDTLKNVTCTVPNNVNLYIDAVKSTCSNTIPSSVAARTNINTASFIY